MATLERCCDCDEPTGNAGRGDGSLFASASGPYCEECYPAARIFELEASLARVTAERDRCREVIEQLTNVWGVVAVNEALKTEASDE